jgi:hypothetical protein
MWEPISRRESGGSQASRVDGGLVENNWADVNHQELA